MRDDFFYWFAVALMGAFLLGVAVGNEHAYKGILAPWQRHVSCTLLIVIGFALVGLRYISAKMGLK